jgi:signal transduction histidine kinase
LIVDLTCVDHAEAAAASRRLAALAQQAGLPRHRTLGIIIADTPAQVLAQLDLQLGECVMLPCSPAELLSRVQVGLQLYAVDIDRQDRLTELLVLEALGRLFSSDSGLTDVLRLAVSEVLKLSGTDFAAILLDRLPEPVSAARRVSETGSEAIADGLDLRLLCKDQQGDAAVPREDDRRVADLPRAGRSVARALGLGAVTRLPLEARGRRAGWLLVGRQAAHALSHRQLARLHHVSALIGSFVDRHALQDDIDRRMRRLSGLQSVLHAVVSAFDAEPVIRASLVGTREVIGADAVRIWLHEERATALQLLAASEPGPGVDRAPVRQSLLGRLLEHRSPQRTVRSTAASVSKLQAVPGGLEGHGAWLGVPFPLGEQGQTVGVLVALRHEPRPFTDEDEEALAALAAGVELALRTVRLYAAVSRAEQDLRDAASLTAIGMLTSSIVHDFAQPMTAAVAMLEVLAAEESLSPHGVDITRRMKRLLLRVGDTTTHLRRFARRTPATSQAVDLHEVLDDALCLVEHEFRQAGVDIVKRYRQGLPHAHGNADAFERVFVNLLSNARDAMEGRTGTVTISTGVGRTARTRGFLEVHVEDTGVGLPEQRQRIFEPLFTTKDAGRGVGLGLSISRRIVEQHGGEIEASNVRGGGARFTVLLPRVTEGEDRDQHSGDGSD